MKKAIKSIFDVTNLHSIQFTVFISFTLSALIAIIMTGVTFYLRFSSQLSNTLNDENQTLMDQVNRSLNAYLGNMIRLADSVNYYIIKNTDMSTSNADAQLQLLYNANSSYVKNITLFSSDGRLIATAPPAILKTDIDVTSEPWFTQALQQTENLHFSTPVVQNLFIDTEGQYSWVISLSSAVEITEGKNVRTGVLLIDLRYNRVSELFNNISLPGGGYLFLIDADGKLIYHPHLQLLTSGLAGEINAELAGRRDGAHTIRGASGRNEVIVRSAGYTGWSVIGIIPEQALNMDALQNILFVLFIFFMYFAITVLVNAALSGRLTDPIQQLEHSVRKVEGGLSETKIYVGGSQEIQQLGRSIQHMVDLMRKLNIDIVEEQHQKQKSELNALQAQINPHFLYNSLDILVWMIEKGQPEEALKIVSALGKFFRLSLSKGKNIITVSDELEHVRNYLKIQHMRYKNKFTYHIEAEQETLELSTIKLVLQPVVENSIYHGMDFMTDDGEIIITSRLKENCLYLCVEDNGPGMTPEQANGMLTREKSDALGSGIGLKNVHERIMLYFGKEYGVTIESEPDEGTKVILCMPAINHEKGNVL